MHFSKLRLSGFKSFVDTTDLLILPGVTGVIGPNGCGKSNLLEALRWVMGETSAKSMRGSGMEDVIFAGAASRPPRNFAEVTLTIDNKERRAPAGFNDSDEIEISRRITRDAGSNYRFNGKEIRARDATTLFADASTGAGSPALVRQGQISELINAKPRARKRILEDAAGIAGLHARRHEATLRLNSAESNLARVVEVLTQLEAREASLTREAERAKRYRSLSRELRLSEAILLFRRWREADREVAHAAETIAQTMSVAGQATQEASEAGRKRIELEERIPKLREDEAIARALFQRAEIERQTLAAREREAEATAERLARQIEQFRADLSREGAIQKDAAEMLERLAAEAESLAEVEDSGEAIEIARAAEEEAAERVSAAEARLDALSADAARRKAERDNLTIRLAEAQRTVERIDGDDASSRDEAETLRETVAAAEETAETARMEAEEAEAAIMEADERAGDAETTRASAVEAAAGMRSELSNAQGAVAALRAEAAQLEKLTADAPAAIEPMLNRVTAQPGYETALGAAIGDDLDAGDADAEGWGWNALPALPDAPAPEGGPTLADFVDAPPALARRLSQIAVVDKADGARLQATLRPGQRLVSREGDLWRWDGLAASAETTAASNAAAARLERRNRLAQILEQLEEAEARAAELDEQHHAAMERARDAEVADAEAREARRRAETRAAEAARAAARAESEITSQRSRLGALESLSESRAQDRAQAESAAAECLSALDALAAADAAGDDEAAREAARTEVEQARSALLSARAEREGLERGEAARADRRQTLVREQESWTRRLADAERQTGTLATRIEEAEAELEEARAEPERIEEQRAELSEKIAEAETAMTAAVDALAEAEAVLRDAVRAEKEAEARLSEAREGRARLEARVEAARQLAAELTAEISEAAGCEPQDFLERFELDPETLPIVKDLERAIVQLRQSRDRLGAVNLRADQELAEIAQERQTLAREREDLDAAIGKLRQGVQALNREGRDRLLAAFEEVNKNFSALFTHLFDGGDAKLVLVESDDPLEAGLEILCQPPGKRLSSLSLLSGGEQTLTAISLIFAVFMVNPAPICVLDEVDAPLDDANVTRFCDLLDEMRRRTDTRFLIISHHAVSMSRMDRLFGVTMIEKGVSQLVSVDLETAVRMVDDAA